MLPLSKYDHNLASALRTRLLPPDLFILNVPEFIAEMAPV